MAPAFGLGSENMGLSGDNRHDFQRSGGVRATRRGSKRPSRARPGPTPWLGIRPGKPQNLQKTGVLQVFSLFLHENCHKCVFLVSNILYACEKAGLPWGHLPSALSKRVYETLNSNAQPPWAIPAERVPFPEGTRLLELLLSGYNRPRLVNHRQRFFLNSDSVAATGAPPGSPLSWYDPSDSDYYTLSGPNYSVLTDKGSNGFDLSGPSAAGAPTPMGGNSLDGFPLVTLTRIGNTGDIGYVDMSSWTIAFVYYVPSSDTTQFHEVLSWSQTSWNAGWRIGLTSSDTLTFTIGAYTTDVGTLVTPSTDGDAAYIFVCQYDATGDVLYTRVNGAAVTTDSSLSPGTTGDGGTTLYIGKGFGASDANIGGIMGEIIIYDSYLSGTNLTNLESYLNSKWAIY